MVLRGDEEAYNGFGGMTSPGGGDITEYASNSPSSPAKPASSAVSTELEEARALARDVAAELAAEAKAEEDGAAAAVAEAAEAAAAVLQRTTARITAAPPATAPAQHLTYTGPSHRAGGSNGKSALQLEMEEDARRERELRDERKAAANA